MFEEILLLLVRLILAWFFVKNGLNHLVFGREGVELYADYSGVPFPRLAVAVSGAVLVFGGLSISTGLFVTAGVVGVVVFLLTAAFWVHRYWNMDSKNAVEQNPHFWKNFAIAGGTLALLLVPQPWSLSL